MTQALLYILAWYIRELWSNMLLDVWQTVCLQILDEFNERIGKLSVVLFEDCLEHLTRTQRILRMDRGNAMIIGVGGSGKKSICRLAAFAAG